MQSVRNLPPQEFKKFVKMLAHGFAAKGYKHRHAVGTPSWRYAASCWRAHVETVNRVAREGPWRLDECLKNLALRFSLAQL
jgi:hypothetical protein